MGIILLNARAPAEIYGINARRASNLRAYRSSHPPDDSRLAASRNRDGHSMTEYLDREFPGKTGSPDYSPPNKSPSFLPRETRKLISQLPRCDLPNPSFADRGDSRRFDARFGNISVALIPPGGSHRLSTDRYSPSRLIQASDGVYDSTGCSTSATLERALH